MIALETFAAQIEQGLNAVGQKYNIKFAVFSDAGTYKKAFKSREKKEKYTNGLLMAGSSSIIPTQGVVIATQSATFEIVVALPDPKTDEEIIAAHRAVLDEYFKRYEVQAIEQSTTDVNGNTVTTTYSVGAVYSLANTGTLAIRDDVGTSITFNVYIEYGYIENGLNSNDCKFTLDGFPLTFTNVKITKSPQAQADAYSDSNGRGTSKNLSFARSFDFVLPAQSGNTGIGAIINSELLDNDLNKIHALSVQMGADAEVKTYSVVFGETTASLEGVDNVGNTISLIEAAVFIPQQNVGE